MNPRPRILVLARNFPNPAIPVLGLWTERLVEASREVADPIVVSPVGYVPPGMPVKSFSRFRTVPRQVWREGIPVHHPRVLVLPGHRFQRFEARLWYPFLRRIVDRLVIEEDISLIHAHFIYPEGVIAARIADRHQIPVITTEQAVWLPWLESHRSVRRQVLAALPRINLVTAVSEAVARSIRDVSGPDTPVELLPNMVQEDLFTPPAQSEPRNPDQVLFVGAVRHVKGLDILVRALPYLIERRPQAHLRVVGDPFFRQYQQDQDKVQRLIRDLGLETRVEFTGRATPEQVAQFMRQAALLAVPSRREAFPAVILEALATGTPVVATRCGGPEEVVNDEVGRLVPIESPDILGAALAEVMEQSARFPAARLRNYCVTRWGRAATVARIGDIYGRVLSQHRRSA